MAGLGLFLSLVLSGAAGGAVVDEEALALPLSAGSRDGVLVLSTDGTRLTLFLPEADGTYVRRVLPTLPAPAASLGLADVDGDGDGDLLLSLRTGGLLLWQGDGRGDFVPLEAPPDPAHAGHHGHRPLVRTLDAEEESGLRAILRGARRLPEAAAPDRARLPSGFVSRTALSGRFSSGEGNDLAVIGDGDRPRVVVISADGLSAVEVTSARTTFNVFVGQGGTVFVPDTVNLAPGDTVHWVWSSLGHTVNSGVDCVSDGLFCSPSNTGCSTNPNSGAGATYDRTFQSSGSFPYFCRPHCFFGMTGTVNVGPTSTNVLEATNFKISRSGTNTTFTYTAACGATSHAIYFGSGSLQGGPSWTDSLCIDASGSHTASIGNPAGLQYFVVVGQNASQEGSYGRDSNDVERSEAREIGACDLGQVVSATCP